MPVRSRSTRFIDTCGRPSVSSMRPSARTPGRPPSCSRISRAIRRAIETSRATSRRLIATSGLPRADRGHAERRVRLCRAEVGSARSERVPADVGEIAAVGIGLVVEEHRHPMGLRPPPRRTRARRRRPAPVRPWCRRARRTGRRRAHRAAGARRHGRRWRCEPPLRRRAHAWPLRRRAGADRRG